MHHIETDDKLCGLYSTEFRAQEARARLTLQSGSRDHPDDFSIDRYALDEVRWAEGFI